MVKTGRRRRAGVVVVLSVAGLLTLLALVLVAGAYRNDSLISSDRGTADAEVVSVSWRRTVVRFETEDGVVHIPKDGVLYSDGLVVGHRLLVEYDRGNPELVRVAGRSAALSLLPGGTTVLFTWLAAAPVLWLLRRGPQQAAGAARSL